MAQLLAARLLRLDRTVAAEVEFSSEIGFDLKVPETGRYVFEIALLGENGGETEYVIYHRGPEPLLLGGSLTGTAGDYLKPITARQGRPR